MRVLPNELHFLIFTKDTANKPLVEDVVGLPVDRNYEVFHKQPQAWEFDSNILYLTAEKPGSRRLLIAVNKEAFNELVNGFIK